MDRPKVLAYYPLHYGAEYLYASVKSIAPFVDEIIILYTEKPSYGFATNIPCPETEAQLGQIAQLASVECEIPVIWEKVQYGNEGDHRNHIWKRAEGYDLILGMDGDEVWEPKDLERCLMEAHYKRIGKYIGVAGFINFWRSFNFVCTDGFTPIRIYKVNGDENVKGETVNGTIYHFSCAQSETIMRYKYAIHGHKEEIRKGWLENIYFGWKPGDKFLHPVSLDVWGEAVPFDKTLLPDVLKQHENYNKTLI